MVKPFSLYFLFIFYTLLSVHPVFSEHSSRNDNPLSSNDKVASRRLSIEEERLSNWNRWNKLNKRGQLEPSTAALTVTHLDTLPTAEQTVLPTTVATVTPETPYYFDGLVLTTIDVRNVEGNSNKVHFSGSIEADLNDQTGVFIHNIVRTDEREDGAPIFEAELVEMDEVSRFFESNKVLFCIHGYGREPHKDMRVINEAKEHFKHYVPVPIFWPTYDISWDEDFNGSYEYDKIVAEAVGKTLAIFFRDSEFVKHNPNAHISFMAHSLGNRVLQYFAAQVHALHVELKFRNIFMIAADIDCWIFESDYGVYIVDMLSDGKVYVAHRRDDLALLGSARTLNSDRFRDAQNRLGQFGADRSKMLVEKGKVKNVNMVDFPSPDWPTNHNYNFVNYLIWLYDSK